MLMSLVPFAPAFVVSRGTVVPVCFSLSLSQSAAHSRSITAPDWDQMPSPLLLLFMSAAADFTLTCRPSRRSLSVSSMSCTLLLPLPTTAAVDRSHACSLLPAESDIRTSQDSSTAVEAGRSVSLSLSLCTTRVSPAACESHADPQPMTPAD